MIIDPNKLYDGLLMAEAGVDSGNDPSLIGRNQVAMAVNVTFRGGKPVTRPPWERLHLTFPQDDAQTTQISKPVFTVENRWTTGFYQGCAFYEGIDPVDSGLIVARGGRLFIVKFRGSVQEVTEITASTAVTVLVSFARPIPNNQVTVTLSSVTAFNVGDGLVIDSGTYTVLSVDQSLGTAVLSYGGGGANATILAGTPVNDYQGLPVFLYDTNPDGVGTFVHIFKAKQYAIVCQIQPVPQNLLVFDGSSTRRLKGSAAIPTKELPPAFCGCYVANRIWLALPNRVSYMAGDIDGGSSDILHATENDLILQGGSFQVPAGAGQIAGISKTIVLDTSQGQGPVAIVARRSIWTNQAPTDRTTWQQLTYPIQTEAAVEFGAFGPYSIINVNADLWYRSPDGIRSFIIARRDFNSGWGNTPMSHEVGTILDADNQQFLMRCSKVLFDNRLLTTATPRMVSDGVIWKTVVPINFDEISGMFNKTNPSWEGAWTGLDIFQIAKCTVEDEDRCFAVVRGDPSKQKPMEIWELHTIGVDDQSYHTIEARHVNVLTPIDCRVDLRATSFETPMEPKLLQVAEWFQEEVYGNVNWTISFRPDNYPSFVPWHSVSVCFNTDACHQVCGEPYQGNPGYVPALETPRAPEDCLANGRVANLGYEFQARVRWTGHAKLKSIRLQAERALTALHNDPCQNVECSTLDTCDPLSGWLGYQISDPANIL